MKIVYLEGLIYIFILNLNSVIANDCLVSFKSLFKLRVDLRKYGFENISFLIFGKRNGLFRRNWLLSVLCRIIVQAWRIFLVWTTLTF